MVIYSFDPLESVWSFVEPINESVPSFTVDFGLAAVSDGNSSSLWIFGGSWYTGIFKFVMANMTLAHCLLRGRWHKYNKAFAPVPQFPKPPEF
jgi:hypothetical protein